MRNLNLLLHHLLLPLLLLLLLFCEFVKIVVLSVGQSNVLVRVVTAAKVLVQETNSNEMSLFVCLFVL